MKIAYAGFDLMYPAMEALAQNNEIIKLFTCTVDGVYETNDQAIRLAEKLKIPVTTDRITREDIDKLLDMGCELLISAGYYYRIPIDTRLPMVNIHPSLLPYGRGAWPMPQAILDGIPESGVTVHKTEEDFDTGDILLQNKFEIDADETLTGFMGKVNALLPAMMNDLTAHFADLWNNARPQGYGEYQPQPDPAEYVITAADTMEYADRVLRAFFGFPCYYSDGGHLHELVGCRAFRQKCSETDFPLADGWITQKIVK